MARKKGGLGRGLAALIPEDQQDEKAQPSRPLDVFFGEAPADRDSAAAPMRGGSARDLLMPATSKRRDRKKVAAKTGRGNDGAGTTDSAIDATAQPETDVSRETSRDTDLVRVEGVTFGEIRVDSIVENRWQPREVFDEERLEELAQSIGEVGVLQPIVVRPLDDVSRETSSDEPTYEIIMGERRWRATRRAGLETIPALIRRAGDDEMLREALLENLQRVQLNPLEEAAAYEQLMDEFNYTQAQLAEKIARSRSQIANTLRLLRLPASVQRRVAAEVISAGHARALLGLTEESDMEYLADRIVAEGLSVRTTEEIVALGDVAGAARKRTSAPRIGAPSEDSRYTPVIDRLTDMLDTRIKVHRGKKRGKIVIEFSDDEDLARIEGLITRSQS